ncbi:hypothetical protein KAJ27_09285, partial [bacterium]|nr:hypothetical protein [bacterium]
MVEKNKPEDNAVDKTEDSKSVEKTEEETVKPDIYSTDKKGTFKNNVMISNFKLAIVLILSMVDVGEIVQIVYKMVAILNGKKSYFKLTAKEFSASAFMESIYREVGPDAILYGSPKDLMIAVQESITTEVPHAEISLCTGFTQDYKV